MQEALYNKKLEFEAEKRENTARKIKEEEVKEIEKRKKDEEEKFTNTVALMRTNGTLNEKGCAEIGAEWGWVVAEQDWSCIKMNQQ